MTASVDHLDTQVLSSALQQRLTAIAPHLSVERGSDEHLATFLQRLCEVVTDRDDAAEGWLLFVGIVGAFPTPDELAEFRRRLDLAPRGSLIVAALEQTMLAVGTRLLRGPSRRLRIVDDAVVVDVHFCSTHEHNSGIQRVVRNTVPQWEAAGHNVQLVAWTADYGSMRALTATETERVLRWNDPQRDRTVTQDDADELVVPWRTQVILPEVPLDVLCGPLATITASSGNRVCLVGYDAIPLVSAESVVAAESERFAHYLSMLKHADRVVAISESAAQEFRGFASGLAAQGLVGPDIVTSLLPSETRPRPETPEVTEKPLVLCVGSHEERKNQEAVLFAAEILWREGLDFSLVFVGNGDRVNTHPFDMHLKKLRKAGRDVRAQRRLSDTELWKLYPRARFSAFVSLHEGYGLPVAESLAFGTPVLTSDFGSLSEIAAGGGCVQVDPRSDEQIIDGMRALLTDDKLINRLHDEIGARPHRSWSDYAEDLWSLANDRSAP